MFDYVKMSYFFDGFKTFCLYIVYGIRIDFKKHNNNNIKRRRYELK